MENMENNKAICRKTDDHFTEGNINGRINR